MEASRRPQRPPYEDLEVFERDRHRCSLRVESMVKRVSLARLKPFFQEEGATRARLAASTLREPYVWFLAETSFSFGWGWGVLAERVTFGRISVAMAVASFLQVGLLEQIHKIYLLISKPHLLTYINTNWGSFCEKGSDKWK